MEYSFEEEHGFKPPRMVGFNVAIVLFKNILSGTQSETLQVPESVIEKQKYLSLVGKVVYIGKASFKGERFKDYELIPKEGDWVVFKPNTGPIINFRGIDMIFTVDDAILSIIDEPGHVTRD